MSARGDKSAGGCEKSSITLSKTRAGREKKLCSVASLVHFLLRRQIVIAARLSRCTICFLCQRHSLSGNFYFNVALSVQLKAEADLLRVCGCRKVSRSWCARVSLSLPADKGSRRSSPLHAAGRARVPPPLVIPQEIKCAITQHSTLHSPIVFAEKC